MRKIWLFLILVVVFLGFTTVADEAECSVEAFFTSPTVDLVIERQILAAIEEAQESLLIAMYSFTDDALGDAVVQAYKDRHLDVRILLDETQANGTNGKEWPKLKAAGIPILVEDVTVSLHHKFAVIDGKLVITGSYNWSDREARNNFENVVFVECEKIARAYTDEFVRIWETLGGSSPSHPIGQDLFIELVSATSPVQQGQDATVKIKTLPGAECLIKVRYKTGYSTAAGLYAKTSDEAGIVSWTWRVGILTAPGTWSIYVTAKMNDETAHLETCFTVTE